MCVGFSILFSIFYVFSFLFYQNEKGEGEIPKVTNDAVNLLSVNDPKEKVVPALPNPDSVKEIHIKTDDYNRKTKPTPLTFKQGQKTVSPRLSKEEILKRKKMQTQIEQLQQSLEHYKFTDLQQTYNFLADTVESAEKIQKDYVGMNITVKKSFVAWQYIIAYFIANKNTEVL